MTAQSSHLTSLYLHVFDISSVFHAYTFMWVQAARMVWGCQRAVCG